MASDQSFVDFVLDQAASVGGITYRKMFGEYALYCGLKIFALVCDNRLFIKPTAGGKAFVGEAVYASPYPGAKEYFLIEDRLDDHEWLSELIRITEKELPLPKLKIKKEKSLKKR